MANPEALGFVHRFVPAPGEGRRTLLLLHGTGGDENDLIRLGQMADPAAALLGVRGQVRENGALRYFRRRAPGVFDESDLIERTHALARFIAGAAERYGLERTGIIALGLSNGANIAASLLLLEPDSLAGAVLLRPMVPLRPAVRPDLGGVPVLLLAGRHDPLVPTAQPEELRDLLRSAGANVEIRWSGAGHALGMADVEETRRFLSAAQTG